jgi:hypothetical protein
LLRKHEANECRQTFAANRRRSKPDRSGHAGHDAEKELDRVATELEKYH